MKHSKRTLFLLMVCLMVILVTAVSTFAATDKPFPNPIEESYSEIIAGSEISRTDLSWTLDEKGVLTISGTGDFSGYDPDPTDNQNYLLPWYKYEEQIFTVVIEDGVTSMEADSSLEFGYVDTYYIADSCSGVSDLVSYMEDREETTLVYCNTGHAISSKWLGSETKVIYLDKPEEEYIISGTYGNFIHYELNQVTGVLSITSSKAVDLPMENAPWSELMDYVRHLEINGEFSFIPSKAFASTKIRTATLNSSLTGIGESAFDECERLYHVSFPDTITTIGNRAFRYTKLKKVEIPKSVKIIEHATFEYCSDLSEVVFHEGLEQIKSSAFSNCENITQVDLPDSLISLDGFDRTGISELEIPKGVKSVGTFSRCKNLKELIIPDGVESIGAGFYHCTALEKVVIPDSVNKFNTISYGGGFFEGCKSLKTFEIPPCFSSIEEDFFLGCSSLEEIIIPNTVDYVASTAFKNCSNLKNIVFPYTVMYLNDIEFTGCESLEQITFYNKTATIPVDITYVSPNAVIHGFTGSTAETYANEFGHTFVSLDGHAHEWGAFVQDKKPTCSSEGMNKRICSLCGEEDIEKTAKLPHTEYAINAVAPTCTETGLTEGMRCSSCYKMTVSQQTVPAKGHTETTVTTKATMSKDGKVTTKCTDCSITLKETTIYKASTVKLSASKSVYNGKKKAPKVTIKDSKGKTISSDNYTIKKATGLKNVGKYTYKITFKNQYKGTKSLTYTINPKATSITKKPTAAKKAFTVKWKKVSTQASGYEIMYSTSKKFTKKTSKTVTIKSYKTTSKKITKLKAKKTYYVKVRTYRTVNGKKYYSNWSSYKTVQTK